MGVRRSVQFGDETAAQMHRIATKRGISDSRAIEVALEWRDRCDVIPKGARIKSVTVILEDDREETYLVL